MTISIDDVRAAATRIKTHAVRTPLLENAALNERCGMRVFIKPENLQRTGSFKFRGAFNRLVQLSPDEKEGGVVAWSSGNHAQGVAAAAQILGIRAAIVMPEDAPKIKIENTRAYGAEVIFYDRYKESRERIGASLAEERGAVLVPSYDDPAIMAGQGTCGLEIAEDVGALGAEIDAALVCCGGGGLIAGSSLALQEKNPNTKVYSVEPAGFDDHARSLVSGQREKIDPDATSICDALLAPMPGDLTFAVNKNTLAGGLVVTDDEVRAAMRFAFSVLKLVCEPGGSVALAALLSGKLDIEANAVAIVISGGNVDQQLFADTLIAR